MTDDAPGWSAIDAALAKLYGETVPRHVGTVLSYRLGGPDPLDGISVYTRTEPVPHWHFVSYGMTELYEKTGDNPEESGWGFEFTFRLRRDPADDSPPMWPAGLLQNLARYVFSSGNWFEPGHRINANGPIAADREDCLMRALAFTRDPELGEIDTPHGRMIFLQAVGLTLDEHEACERWNTLKILDLIAPRTPLFVTDIHRTSVLDDPGAAEAVRRGVAEDGTSTDAVYLSAGGWEFGPDGLTLRLGALSAEAVASMVRGRLAHGRDFTLDLGERAVVLFAAERWSHEERGTDLLRLGIPPEAVAEFADALRPRAGRYPVGALLGLTVEIEPTVVRDQYGEETGTVVG